MSGLLLDTNIPSELVRPQPDAKVKKWLAAQQMDTLFLSVVSIGELRKGITITPDGRKKIGLDRWLTTELLPLFSGRVLPITQEIADRWGQLEGHRQLAGRQLSSPDGMIAATALEYGLSVVTRNVRDFDGLGLEIFNPWD